jgi:hypothetical protein
MSRDSIVYSYGALWSHGQKTDFSNIEFFNANAILIDRLTDTMKAYRDAKQTGKFKGRVHVKGHALNKDRVYPSKVELFNEWSTAAESALEYGFEGISIDEFSIQGNPGDSDKLIEALVKFRTKYPMDKTEFTAWIVSPDYIPHPDHQKNRDAVLQHFCKQMNYIIPELYAPSGREAGIITKAILDDFDCDFGYAHTLVQNWEMIAPGISRKILLGMSPYVPFDLRHRFGFHYEGFNHLGDMIKGITAAMRLYEEKFENSPLIDKIAGMAIWGMDYFDKEQLSSINALVGRCVLERAPSDV